jgi:hypothetical protein
MSEALANTNNSGGAEDRQPRSAGVDFCGVGRIQSRGIVTEGLRTSTAKSGKGKRGEREEKDYIMQTPLKVLKVLEALEGRAFEPASINRVAQRTGFTQSFCRAALLTLKEAGYAKRTFDGWIIGPKLALFANRITGSFRNSE